MKIVSVIIIHVYSFSNFYAAPINVGYDQDAIVARESAGNITITITVFSHLSTGAPRPFTLAFNTEDGTASMFCTIHFTSHYSITCPVV